MTPKLFCYLALVCLLAACNRKPVDPVGDKPIKESAAYKKSEAEEKSHSSDRLKWNREIRGGAYDKIGSRNPKWDAPARQAMEYQAQLVTSPNSASQALIEQMQASAKAAIAAGCDDALVGYIHTRYVVSNSGAPATNVATAFVASASAMELTQYGDMMKFFACVRASNALRAAYPRTNIPPEWRSLLGSAAQYATQAISDRKTPVDDAYIAAAQILSAMERIYPACEEFYRGIEKPMFKNWPDSALPYIIKADFYTDFAWKARGGGYADTVTQEGWKLFGERIKESEGALTKAWELNPGLVEIPEKMITICMAASKPRPEMEKWFARAMELAPNDYDACKKKLFFLEPKWFGSAEDMLKFGRECVAADWPGMVCLTLVDAHEAISRYIDKGPEREAYWHRAEVWEDTKSAYEKFFHYNPNDVSWRHNYAWYAARCEQWEDFNKQVALMGPVNYPYFGGKEAFEEMVAKGKKAAGGKAK